MDVHVRRSGEMTEGAFGRTLFGASTLLLGVATLVLRDQLVSDWSFADAAAFIVVSGIAMVAGGGLVLVARTERAGAGVLACAFVAFALTAIPGIVAQPRAYYTWGEIFYRLSSVAGAVIAFIATSRATPRSRAWCRAAVVVFGLCDASYAAEQVEYLARTASLVPAWMPFGGTFWTIVTTVAFGLGAVAMIAGIRALLALRLTATMLALFGLVIWIPALIAAPRVHSNWSEGLETFAIAGAAWIVASYLANQRAGSLSDQGLLGT